MNSYKNSYKKDLCYFGILKIFSDFMNTISYLNVLKPSKLSLSKSSPKILIFPPISSLQQILYFYFLDMKGSRIIPCSSYHDHIHVNIGFVVLDSIDAVTEASTSWRPDSDLNLQRPIFCPL